MTGMSGAAEVAPPPPSAAFADELAFTLEVAERAGAVQMDHYERLERIDHKSARDVVTEADHLSEALILEAIRARYPDDAIWAEETGEHNAKAGEAPSSVTRWLNVTVLPPSIRGLSTNAPRFPVRSAGSVIRQVV